jgi:hypothetical protein
VRSCVATANNPAQDAYAAESSPIVNTNLPSRFIHFHHQGVMQNIAPSLMTLTLPVPVPASRVARTLSSNDPSTRRLIRRVSWKPHAGSSPWAPSLSSRPCRLHWNIQSLLYPANPPANTSSPATSSTYRPSSTSCTVQHSKNSTGPTRTAR